jgi:hypothetical protein
MFLVYIDVTKVSGQNIPNVKSKFPMTKYAMLFPPISSKVAPAVATITDTMVPHSSLTLKLVAILTSTMFEKNNIAPLNMKIKLLDSTPQRKCCCAKGVTTVSQDETPIFTNNARVNIIINLGLNNFNDIRSNIYSSGWALASIDLQTNMNDNINTMSIIQHNCICSP